MWRIFLTASVLVGTVAILLWPGPAVALEKAEEQELAQLMTSGVKPQTIQLNDAAIQHYRHPEGEDAPHEFLVISRAGASQIKLAAHRFTMRMMQIGDVNGPNAIFVGESGGEHCCYTLHLLWIERELRYDAIELAGSEPTIESGRGAPRIQFKDMSFANWHASLAQSPAPPVVLSYEFASRSYVADVAAMRKPAPDSASLAGQAAAIRKTYETLPEGKLDPALWTAMLDLIYSGNADAARTLLDAAWPPERPGEDAFLTAFSKQLWQGATWRRFELGRALDADLAFPRIGGKR